MNSEVGTSDGGSIYSFYVNELLHTASKSTPNPPKECSGGILADSMGLGKTVMLMSLISKDKERRQGNKTVLPEEEKDSEDEEKKLESCLSSDNEQLDDRFCTLVVTPLSLLPQWEDEIASKTSLTYKTSYGESSSRVQLQTDLNRVDVLITTCKYHS